MPKLSTDDRRILDYVQDWYATHRGALSAGEVATALRLPLAQVAGSAGVLAAAGRVRIYPSPHLRDGRQQVHFVGTVTTSHRSIDLTTAPIRSSSASTPSAATVSVGAAALDEVSDAGQPR